MRAVLRRKVLLGLRLMETLDLSGADRSINELREGYGEFYTVADSFLISLESDKILRPLSLRYLAGYLKEDMKLE